MYALLYFIAAGHTWVFFQSQKNAGKNFFSRAGDNESPGYGK